MTENSTEKKEYDLSFRQRVSSNLLRLLKMIIMAIKRFREPYYNGFAGQISFYLCLSMVPMLMVIAQILTATKIIPLESVLHMLQEYSQDNVPDIVKNLLSTKLTFTSNIVFILLSCWAASKAQFAISRIANYTLSNGQTTGKGYFVDRFRAVLTMLITIFAICLALIILIYGKLIFEIVVSVLNKTFIFQADTTKLIMMLRWPAFMVMFFLILVVNYYIMPTIHVKFRDVVPGAVISTIGMMIVTLVFSKYLTTIGNYNIIYGSLASIAALLMWFYLIAWAIGVGVMCNKLIMETRPDYVEQRREERKLAKKLKRNKAKSKKKDPYTAIDMLEEEVSEVKEKIEETIEGAVNDILEADPENLQEAVSEERSKEQSKEQLKEQSKEQLKERSEDIKTAIGEENVESSKATVG